MTDSGRTAAYIIGLDLGKRQDYTALTVLAEREEKGKVRTGRERASAPFQWHFEEYWLQHLCRWQLGTKYSTTAADVGELTRRPPFRRTDTALVVDRGGVGEAVFEQIEDEAEGGPVELQGITITGGKSVTRAGPGHLRVPKRDLVAALQVAVQNSEIRAASDLELWPVLRSEMESFTAEITQTGHDTYEARQGEHDDIALALALPMWLARRRRGRGTGEYVDSRF